MQDRQAPGGAMRRLRAGIALILLAGAACADDAVSGKAPPENMASPQGEATANRLIEIVPLEAAHPGDAALFSAFLSEEAARSPLPLSIGGALGAGEAEGNTYLVAVIELADREGKALHRLVREATLERGANREEELQRFAASTLGDIATWYAGWSPPAQPSLALNTHAPQTADSGLVTGSIVTPAPPRFGITFGPAPGDGARALTAALDAALKGRLKDAPWLTARDFSIEGSIVTASRGDGRTDVSINWLVKSADGRKLGEIHQKNALSPDLIAGKWGEVAETAARAAADGVIAVLEPAPARVASND